MFKLTNKTYFEQLVEIKLKELIPNVDCYGRDHELFIIAQNDLRYYLMLKWNFTIFNFKDFDSVFMECIYNSGKTIKLFIDNFLSNWYRKWLQRVKILSVNDNINENMYEHSVSILFNIPKRVLMGLDEYLLPLVECLFNHGEFACVEQIADRALKMTLAQSKHKPKTIEDKLRFLQAIMSNMVDEVTGFKGPLIYFRLNRNYF